MFYCISIEYNLNKVAELYLAGLLLRDHYLGFVGKIQYVQILVYRKL